MESAGPFVYLERYRLAVCEECGLAVLSREVLSHLRGRHRGIDIPRRRRIADTVSSWPAVIQDQAGLIDFRLPPRSISYIPQLAAPETDGLKCRQCPYVARHLQMIQKHCRDTHGWVNSHGAGRPGLKRKRRAAEAGPGLPWREEVACQLFFRSRYASGWFEVASPKCMPR